MIFRFSGAVAVGGAIWLAVNLLGCGGGGGGGGNSPTPAPPDSGGAGCGYHCSTPDNCYHPSWGTPCSQAGSEAACTGSSSSAQWCPGPAPAPPPCPSPPTPSNATTVGYWIWSWEPTCVPLDADFTVAFSGWANVSKAKVESMSLLTAAVGDTFFALGGGNEHGAFTTDLLRAVTDAIINDELQAWTGLALDVEYCNASGLAPSFQDVLAAAKSKGMKTMVTVSHTAPVGCPDQVELMTAFFQDTNIDYLSPQLYTNGNETSPDFAETYNSGVSFDMYKGASAAFLPSIVSASQFEAVAAHFPNLVVDGFVQWSHAVAKYSSPPVTAV